MPNTRTAKVVGQRPAEEDCIYEGEMYDVLFRGKFIGQSGMQLVFEQQMPNGQQPKYHRLDRDGDSFLELVDSEES